MVKVVGDVLHARRVSDTIVVSVSEDRSGISSIAGTSDVAVDDGLRGHVEGAGVKTSQHDVKSVTND